MGAFVAAALVLTVTAAASGVNLDVLAATSYKPDANGGTAAKKQAYCDGFIARVASKLKTSPDQVKTAMTDALNQSLAEAVKAGDVTQEQADAIKARGAANNLCTELSGERHGRGAHGRTGHVGLAVYAKALGISEQQFRQELANGKTVKDIAAGKGLDEGKFRTQLVDAAKADLDARVAAGKLTQPEEDTILNRLRNDPLPLWDKPVKKHAVPGSG